MSRILHTVVRLGAGLLGTGLLGLLVPATTCQAQGALWEFGSSPWGGMRYRGPLLSLEIGGAPPPHGADLHGPRPYGVGPHGAGPHAYPLPPGAVPPWHYQHTPPHARHHRSDPGRLHHDLERMHAYRTREQRAADDFRDRYATGDPRHHVHRPAVAPWPARPLGDALAPVPGISYGPAGSQRRSFVADAEVADLLRPAAMRLLGSLSRKRDGAMWLKQLQPDRIIDAIDRAEFPGSLSDLVERYDRVARNPRLVLIAEAEGFRDTHRLLAQYIHLPSRFPQAPVEMPSYEAYMNEAPVVLGEDVLPLLETPPQSANEAAAIELNPALPELSPPQLSPPQLSPSPMPSLPPPPPLPLPPMPLPPVGSQAEDHPAEGEIQILPAPIGEPEL